MDHDQIQMDQNQILMTPDQIQMKQAQTLKNQGSSLLELCDLVVHKDSVEGHCKQGNITYIFKVQF